MRAGIVAVTLCAVVHAAEVAFAAPRPVRCILSGFEIGAVSPEELLANAVALDRLPFDGVTVYVYRDLPDGTRLSREKIMGDAKVMEKFGRSNWTRENVAPLIPVLREYAKHRSLRESLLTFRGTTTYHLDWTNDVAWAQAGENLSVLAWLAKEGGLKGLVGDFEDYLKTSQYVWRKDGRDPPYATTRSLARRRGREVFGKVFEVYPNVTILFYQFLTAQARYQAERDPVERAREFRDLWPAFCDGILDALPPGAKIVDGCETSGYRCEAANGDFYKQAAFQMGGALGLVSPENRAKYRAQTSVSFGMFIDGYAMTNMVSKWYRGPVEGSRLKAFRNDFAQACETVDEYVWLWCQDGRWADWPGAARNMKIAKWRPWEEQIPGVTRTIAYTLHPEEAVLDARRDSATAGVYTNLVASKTHGRTFRGARTCLNLPVQGVHPGERYGIAYSRRGDGERSQVAWRKDGQWNWGLACAFPALSLPDESGLRWRTCFATVPEGANELVLQIIVNQGQDEKLEIGDVDIFRVVAQ